MALGSRVVLMFIQSKGSKIEISLNNLDNSLYFASFIWLVHVLKGQIPWRSTELENQKQ
jgi:hypothetical protein